MEVRNRQMVSIDSRVIRDLQASLHGQVILPEQPEYEKARKVWNGLIDRYPALIVRCADSADVQKAVRFARTYQLEVCVRGGGHSIPGYSTIDNGIVIDLSLMKDILVDVERRLALVSAGLTLDEFMQATVPHGLATTTGTVSETGVAGLTLGSGVGWLMGKYGLACDNVLSFEMVTAQGELVNASPAENPDLYWGLRGGGGNFGIVTSFEFQLHPISTIIGGMLVYPITQARAVLQFYRDFAAHCPDDLTVYAALLTSPEGHPVAAIMPCYYGDLSEGERVLAPLRQFGPPLADMVRPMSYLEMIHLIDDSTPTGRKYYDKSCTLRQLSDEVIERMVAAFSARPSPNSEILIQHLHGAAARIPVDATAFAARGESFMPIFLTGWDDEAAEPHKEWVRSVWSALKPYADDETYVNFMSADEQNRVESAYGRNYARLRELKRRYDPDNFFHMNANIKP